MTQVSLDALVAGAISGSIVSFPTDTVPALATRPDRSELIFIAKQRSQDKPLILMGDTINTLLTLLSRNPAPNGSLAAGGPNILAGCFNLGVTSVRSLRQGHEPPRPDHHRTLGSPTTRSPEKSWPKPVLSPPPVPTGRGGSDKRSDLMMGSYKASRVSQFYAAFRGMLEIPLFYCPWAQNIQGLKM